MLHNDFDSLRYAQLLSIDGQVLVIVGGPHMDLQPEQHVLHSDFESTQRISIYEQVLVIVAGPHMDMQPE